ncbi:CPBP family intramembrane glutamic endopeptidase [Lacinutrix sp. Hel_I_90]|uniref:CPBP family intramembrane glutamic endopeptidase n=1 Tax=Lacinutrix sp. Hel_I_90 TaxID=1249999 RepID=UPI0005C849B3|nr:type II CAAX endopeptidase family protein [Lacinutrix sp. Hel_I_90]
MIVQCRNCNTTFETAVKFCTTCGQSVLKGDNEKRISNLNLIIGFYSAHLLFIAFVYFLTNAYPENFAVDLIIEIGFALLVLGFVALDFKNILKLYNFKHLNWKHLSVAIVFPIFSSSLVYLLIEGFNFLIDDGASTNYFESYLYLENPLFWSILFIAITPPIFEELAFRGFLFNKLRKVTSEKMTIIATAFLFALIHFSFISFLWIFPFGLLLGYLRSKYNTLWLGIIIHFFHNLIVLLLDYYNYYTVLE